MWPGGLGISQVVERQEHIGLNLPTENFLPLTPRWPLEKNGCSILGGQCDCISQSHIRRIAINAEQVR
jgi:hypothetical protein